MKLKYLLLSISIAGSIATYAQEMPAVFNKSFTASGNAYKKAIVNDEEEIFAIGGGKDGVITKCSRNGEVIFNKTINKGGVVAYNDIAIDRNGNLLVVGGGSIAYGSARITKLNVKGEPIFDKSIGQGTGGYFTKVIVDSVNNYIAIGTDGSKPSKARIVKMSAKGDIIFDKGFGSHNVYTDAAIDEDGNIIAVGGDVGDNEGRARITKISPAGEVVFDVELARVGSSFTKVVLLSDNNVLAVGGGTYGTTNPCRIAKLRSDDGQVIYDKPYSAVDGRFTDVSVNQDGGVVTCAEEYEQGRIVRLRPDGTEIYNKTFRGAFHALKMAPNAEVVAVGDVDKLQGKIVKLRADGNVVYETIFDVPVTKMLLTEDGEVYALSAKGYNLLKYSPSGTMMFNKNFGSYGKSTLEFLEQTPSGEIIAGGGGLEDGGRLVKVTHGVMINDVVVSEPINGIANATMTVSITGFLRKKGIRSPVSVAYKTVEGTAKAQADYQETEGSLLFVPADYVIGSPITQTIQVPVLADNLMEGKEAFEVSLAKAENAFITKAKGKVTIIDQPAVLKFIGGSDGAEKDLVPLNYYVGIFKQDNTPLINKTGAPLKIDYSFRNGSAVPGVDFVASTKPVFSIDNEKSEGAIQVKVKDDNAYELKKSVILQMTGTTAVNETSVGFEGGAASTARMQYIIDQPAYVSIVKLADRNASVTAPSAMFKIVLTKADGKTLTNCTGDDVNVVFAVDDSSTAVLGKDFAILEGDMIKIMGDCDNAETVLKVVTINRRTQDGKLDLSDKTIAVKLVSVTGPKDAGMLSINPNEKQQKASADIKGR